MSRKDRRPPQRAPLPGDAAERVAKIIETAERAAAAVVDDAHATAQRYLDEAQSEAERAVAARLAQLIELTDSLVSQAEAIRRQSTALLESLDQAGSQMKATPVEQAPAAASAPQSPPGPELAPGPEPSAKERPRGGHLAAVEPAGERRGAIPPGGGERSGEAAARLLATQMAVSGASREEIEAKLRTGFEIEETGSILDAILGPEE